MVASEIVERSERERETQVPCKEQTRNKKCKNKIKMNIKTVEMKGQQDRKSRPRNVHNEIPSLTIPSPLVSGEMREKKVALSPAWQWLRNSRYIYIYIYLYL